MKTELYDRNNKVLYTFDGADYNRAEIMLMNDLRVWSYRIVENGRTVYVR